MDWNNVPPHLRPEHRREDLGLSMSCRWSDELREIWRLHAEMGFDVIDAAKLAGWGVLILSDDDAT